MAKKTNIGLSSFINTLENAEHKVESSKKEIRSETERDSLDRKFKPNWYSVEEINIEPSLETHIRKQTQEESEQFRESLIKNGIRDSLIVAILRDKKLLVDGHHRFRVGCEIGITKFPVKEIPFNNLNEIKVWMLKNQLGRRNLKDAERIQIASELSDVFRQKAKENLSKGGKMKGWANLPKAQLSHTRDEIAKLANVSPRNVSKWKKVNDEAPTELKDKMMNGEISIHKAYTTVTKNNKEKNNLKDSSLQDKMNKSVTSKAPIGIVKKISVKDVDTAILEGQDMREALEIAKSNYELLQEVVDSIDNGLNSTEGQ